MNPANQTFAQRVIPLLDLTSLNASDDDAAITQLCEKAQTPLGNVAAVCAYPQFVPLMYQLLGNTSINIVTVANFPTGNDDLKTTLGAIQQGLHDGANEIDIVMPYQAYLAGEHTLVKNFIASCKQACGKNILKVILETGALQKPAIISNASRDAIAAGADFIKTSTGKIAVGATFEAATSILTTIKSANKPVGFKASGGIRTTQDAACYLQLAESIMGTPWPTPQTFRLGTSTLLDALLK